MHGTKYTMPITVVTCGICRTEFDSELKFTDHFLLEHTSDTLESDENNQSTICTSETLIEKKRYSELFRNACDICGDIKSSPNKLATHILIHMGAMPYYCSPCNFSCISKLRLQQHIYNHGTYKSDNQRYWLFTKSNMHVCEECDRCFSVWADLVFHYTKHIQAMPYKCHECMLYFSDMKDFIIHSHIHKTTTKCEICHIFFSTRGRLLDHVLEHNKSKLFRKFRHIYWNDGLSPVQNPFSVLRVSHYGRSPDEVEWIPESPIINDKDPTHELRDSMSDFNKCGLNYSNIEELVEYKGKEDVRHLCEVVFKEITVTDSFRSDFDDSYSKHLTTLSNLTEKELCSDRNEGKRKYSMQDLKKTNHKKRSKKNNKSRKLFGSKKRLSRVKRKKCYIKTDNAVVCDDTPPSQCLGMENINEFKINIESLIFKEIIVVVEKLPDDVYDLKSFKRYSERQRRKKLKARKAKSVERKQIELKSCDRENLSANLSKKDSTLNKKNDYQLRTRLRPKNLNVLGKNQNILCKGVTKQDSVNNECDSFVQKVSLRSRKTLNKSQVKDEDFLRDGSEKRKRNNRCNLNACQEKPFSKRKTRSDLKPNNQTSSDEAKSSDELRVCAKTTVPANKHIPKITSLLDAVNHDHSYQGKFKIVKCLKVSQKSIQKQNFSFKRVLKNKLYNSSYKFIKDRKKSRNSIKKRISDRKKADVSRSRRRTSKRKSPEIKINLIKLPDCIYEKHLKQKPIMLSNILPIISTVKSLAPSENFCMEQNYYSLVDHSYTDYLPVILEEHNYCRLHSNESDSESTISNVSDFLNSD